MSLLDFYAPQAEQAIRATPVVAPPPPEGPSVWSGLGRGAGMGLMKGFAETGRNLAMAAAVPSVLIENTLGGGTSSSDAVFRAVDELFNPAVKYWEPGPDEVGAAGQVLGGLLNMGAKAAAGGVAGLVANEQMSASLDLQAQGLSDVNAVVGGASRGLLTGVGVLLPPAMGSSRLSSAAIGAVVNPALGAYDRFTLYRMLQDEGLTQAAEQYRPLDPVQLAVEAAFGAVAGAAFGKAKTKAAGEGGVVDAAPAPAPMPLLREAAQTALLREERIAGQMLPRDPIMAERADRLNAAAEARALAGEGPMVVHPETPLDPVAVREGKTRLLDAWDEANGRPLGGADSPLARLLPEDIAAAAVARGAQVLDRSGVTITTSAGGAVRLEGRAGSAVTLADLRELPTLLREYLPTVDDQGRSTWVIERPDRPSLVIEVKVADGKATKVVAREDVRGDMTPSPRSPLAAGGPDLMPQPPRAAAPAVDAPAAIRAAQDAYKAAQAAGDVPGFLASADLAPEVRNLAVGLAEAGANAGRAERMLADFTRAAAADARPAVDIAADVVEASRRGETLTPDGAGTTPAAPQVRAAQSVLAERPDLTIPVGLDAEGNVIVARAADVLRQLQDELQRAQTDAKAFAAGANCFLRS